MLKEKGTYHNDSVIVADEMLHSTNEDKKSLQCYQQLIVLTSSFDT